MATQTELKTKTPDAPAPKRLTIRGTVMWAHLSKPNEMSGKYQLDVCNLTREAVEACRAAGLEVKKGEAEKADKGHYITPKATKPVRIVDASKIALSADKLIGNGSLVNVLVNAYAWEFKGKSGIGAGLEAVQVLKLEEREADPFVVEEEFAGKVDDVNF